MRSGISEEEKKIWISDISRKEYKVSITDGENVQTFLNDGIKEESIEISEVLEDSAQLTFSGCYSKRAKVTLRYVGDLVGKGITISAKAIIGDNETSELTLFTGTIFEVTQNGNDDIVSTITAYDVMERAINTDVAEWYNTLEFPITLQGFADSLAAYLATIDIALNSANLPLGDEVVEETILPQNLALKDVLIAIATINGMFCYCDYENVIRFKALTKLETSGLFPSETIYPSDDLFPADYISNAEDRIANGIYKSLVYQNYDVATIDKVICREDSDDIGAIFGTGTNAYIVEGNFLLYGKNAEQMAAVAQAIYTLVEGYIYTPAKVVCPARPWIECGDLIELQSEKNVIYTYVLERTFKGVQVITDTYQSKQDALREEQNNSINTQIIQLRGKANRLTRDIEHMTSEIYNEDGSSKIEQNAQAIELKVSRGDVSSQLSLEEGKIEIKSDRISIDSTNFKLTERGEITATKGNIAGLTINDWGFSYSSLGRTKIKINVSGNPLFAAGNDTDQLYSCTKIDSTGNLTAPKITVGGVGTTEIDGYTIKCALNSTRYTEYTYEGIEINTSSFAIKHSTTKLLSNTNGNVLLGDTTNVVSIGGKYLNFFTTSVSTTGGAKQKVAKLATSATLANTITKVNDLLTALNAYNLISLV